MTTAPLRCGGRDGHDNSGGASRTAAVRHRRCRDDLPFSAPRTI